MAFLESVGIFAFLLFLESHARGSEWWSLFHFLLWAVIMGAVAEEIEMAPILVEV